MPEDPVRQYLNAREELDNSLSRIKAMQSIMSEASNALEKPFEFKVVNVDIIYPPELSRAKDITSIDAKQWPDARRIAETIAGLHRAYRQVFNLWAYLPERDKKNLSPPPPR